MMTFCYRCGQVRSLFQKCAYDVYFFSHYNVSSIKKEFASAIRELSSCGGGYKFHLIISKIELTVCVLNILVPALQNINVGRFALHTRLNQ